MILITGGAGFIGSHTCVELLQAGHQILVLDNLSNANVRVFKHLERICGQPIPFMQGDMRDRALLDRLFEQYPIQAVIHLAGLKAVGESVGIPLAYYDNNVGGTLVLLQAMQAHGVKKLVFSSSATVYGEQNPCPYTEDMPVSRCTNPYGQTKAMIEFILEDLFASDPEWGLSILRYFNPIGAHPSGLIGENPSGIPNNLSPYIAQVAIGIRPELMVYGNDYPTPDGTGVRDYIHVVDLAQGHVLALDRLLQRGGLDIYNLGTGKGASVMDVLHAFENACGHALPYRVVERRPGDLAETYANANKAKQELGWEAKYNLDQMCADIWRWQSRFPQGFETEE